MSFGCTLPIHPGHTSPENLRTLAVRAEELGFNSIWVGDHIIIPYHISSPYPYSATGASSFDPKRPQCEPLTLLAYVAGFTQRIRLGTHVLILPYRNPVVIGKMVATLDFLSGGRMDLGIGVGWMEEEFHTLGLTSFPERGAVTDEHIRIFKALWTQEKSTFHGRYHQFSDIGSFPKPVQKPHPPIWVGGHTSPALRRAAELGDGWLPIGLRPGVPVQLEPPEMAAMISQLREMTRKAGRAPNAVEVCFSANMEVHDRGYTQRRLLSGTPAEIIGDIHTYQEIGVQHFVFTFPGESREQIIKAMEQFVAEVLPSVT